MGGGRRDRRTAVSAAAVAEEALRRGCEDVLRLEKEGDTAGASDLALKLVDQHPKSAAPYNLLGFLMEGAAAKLQEQLDKLAAEDPPRVRSDVHADAARTAEDRARAEDKAAATSHLAAYLEGCAGWYRKAAHLAPRCAFTRASYARTLGMCSQSAEAYQEFNSALKIRSPEIPEHNNPWLRSTDLVSDEEKKASVIAMANAQFDYFLHLSDAQVYTACRDLLFNVRTQGTPGVQAKKEAKELALRYPFSARANLLRPFLTRTLIESSTSSIPKIKRYQKLLREIADCVDMFPSSIVISLFRAEVLYSMGQYLDASLECIRGLKITKPDDPVSQDIPPGYASGSGRNGRTGNIIIKLVDLLEQSEEKVVDAKEIETLLQALHFKTEDDAVECLVKELIEDLNIKFLQDLCLKPKSAEPDLNAVSKEKSQKVQRRVPMAKNVKSVKGSLSKDKKSDQVPTENPELNTDANEGDHDEGHHVITIPQSLMYSSKYKQKKSEEAVRPQQVVGNRTVPRETVDSYVEYCFLRSLCPVKKEICHLCIFEKEKYYASEEIKGNMIRHCTTVHFASTIKCDVRTCAARFRTEEDKELHHHYCHVLDKDWWRSWW